MAAATDQTRTARWVQWGRGTWHVQAEGVAETVCGREVPEDARTTIYKPAACQRCKTKAPELVEAAEARREAAWEEQDAKRAEALEANRAGKFVVLRCRLCGAQHVAPGGGGYPFCMRAGHVAELEAVEATGPAWEAA